MWTAISPKFKRRQKTGSRHKTRTFTSTSSLRSDLGFEWFADCFKQGQTDRLEIGGSLRVEKFSSNELLVLVKDEAVVIDKDTAQASMHLTGDIQQVVMF